MTAEVGTDVTDAARAEFGILVAIIRTVTIAASLGYIVTLDLPRPPDVDDAAIGNINYAMRRIWVLPEAHPVQRLLILLHEVGHAVAAKRMGVDALTVEERGQFSTGEERALLYGWGVARHLELTGRGGLTRELWYAFNGLAPPG